MAGEPLNAPVGFPETFDPENRHPEYEAWKPSWTKARDCFDGEEAVKAKNETYLPMPAGMSAASNLGSAYASYQLRAQVLELMALTVRGIAGVIHRKPAIFTLPGGLDDIVERATKDRMTLETFHRRVTSEVLKVGRYGILTDAPANGGVPYLSGYVAETIIDWDVGDDGELDLVVLDESGPDRNAAGIWVNLKRWRRLSRWGGAYYVEVWEQAEGEAAPSRVQLIQPTAKSGQPLDRIPFVFVGTTDLTAMPDDVPLAQVAASELSIYRLDADYRHSLFMTAQPTPVIIGVDQESTPRYMGSSVAWLLPEGGDAKILEFQGSGIAALRQAIRDDLDLAVMAGARMFEENSESAESGVAKQIRYGAQTATITTVSQTTGAGLERALGAVALFTGADPDSVEVTANTDFVEMRLEPAEVTALVESWLKGAISKTTMFENLKRGGLIAESRSFEDEQELIQEEAPDLGVPAAPEPEPAPAPEDEPA